MIFLAVGMVLLFIAAIGCIIYMNTSKKIKRKWTLEH